MDQKQLNLCRKLQAVRSQLDAAKKDSRGYNYQYASLSEVYDTIEPLCFQAGLGIFQVTEVVDHTGVASHKKEEVVKGSPVTTEDFGRASFVRMVTQIVDLGDGSEGSGGGELISRMDVPCQMFNDPQAYGSAVTYARRYGLLVVFGIRVEDDDGQGARRTQQRNQKREAAREALPPPPEAGKKPDPGFKYEEWLESLRNAETMKDLETLGRLGRMQALNETQRDRAGRVFAERKQAIAQGESAPY